MKKHCVKWVAVAALCLLAIGAGILAAKNEPIDGLSEYLSASARRKVGKEIEQAAESYRDLYIAAEKLPPEYSGGAQRIAQEDIDAFEERLMGAGFATLDSDSTYPTYLANPSALRQFWEAVSKGENGELTVLRISSDGGFQHLFFCREGDEAYFVRTDLTWDENNELYVSEWEARPLYDMELTDWGIFYYQTDPEDPHYITYSQIRLEPVDRELYDLTIKYILPVGYRFTNLFLCDWQVGDWGDLSLTDTFEYLYADRTGQTLDWEQFPSRKEPIRFEIPAALFEETVLSYFSISVEQLRTLTRYDESLDCYLWRPCFGDDLTSWKYPMCEPEVTDCVQNADGTMTLTVKVYSPDLKTDSLFVHAVTVRPLADDSFQYVANEVISASGRGLPPAMARFELDEA